MIGLLRYPRSITSSSWLQRTCKRYLNILSLLVYHFYKGFYFSTFSQCLHFCACFQIVLDIIGLHKILDLPHQSLFLFFSVLSWVCSFYDQFTLFVCFLAPTLDCLRLTWPVLKLWTMSYNKWQQQHPDCDGYRLALKGQTCLQKLPNCLWSTPVGYITSVALGWSQSILWHQTLP